MKNKMLVMAFLPMMGMALLSCGEGAGIEATSKDGDRVVNTDPGADTNPASKPETNPENGSEPDTKVDPDVGPDPDPDVDSDALVWPQQKFGVFIHYGFGGTTEDGDYAFKITQNRDGSEPQSVNEVADNFDLDQFVEDMVTIGPEYVIFTAWHGAMNPVYPSEVMTEWGVGHRRSDRDLVGEVADALKAVDIDVILYTQPGSPNRWTPADQEAIGWAGLTTYSESANDFMNEIYAEMSGRYGTKIKGFWFDNGANRKSIDKERLRNTVLSKMPNAALISINAANDVTDYGMAEIRKPHMFGSGEGFENVVAADEETWPGLDKSVAFVNDQYWWSVPGSYSLDPVKMYKYTVMQAATNVEGGGVAWALGPFPGDQLWNSNVMPSMSDLGARVAAVSESIKNTYPSTSYPSPHGTRISELEWGCATQSTDGKAEYLHVLIPPAGGTLTIAVPADGKKFSTGTNLRTDRAVGVVQTANEITLTLDSNDSWDAVDTVIKLVVD